jgi:hypothetical protein
LPLVLLLALSRRAIPIFHLLQLPMGNQWPLQAFSLATK